MNDEPSDPLEFTPEESAAYRALRVPVPASLDADLETRVVAGLRSRGVLRRARSGSLIRLAAAVVLAASLFGAGVATGSARRAQPVPAGAKQYLLLLYEDAGSAPPTQADHEARVREYRAWARDLARAGRLVAAGELENEMPRSAADPVGYFVITAPSQDDAARVMRTCPHLRHGGRVVLRTVV